MRRDLIRRVEKLEDAWREKLNAGRVIRIVWATASEAKIPADQDIGPPEEPVFRYSLDEILRSEQNDSGDYEDPNDETGSYG
jgi:hypothetical protein